MSTERVNDALHQIGLALDESSAHAVEIMTKYVQREPEENEIFACMELWWEQDYSLGYNRFFVTDVNGEQVLVTKWDETALGHSLVPGILNYFDNYYQNMSRETEFTEAESMELSDNLERTLLGWMAHCWRVAGGEQTKLPTYFCFEKEYKVRDLMTGEIMSEEEAARKLGYNATVSLN